MNIKKMKIIENGEMMNMRKSIEKKKNDNEKKIDNQVLEKLTDELYEMGFENYDLNIKILEKVN